MLSGNTYFRCISMIFDHLPYFSVSKSIFDDKMISQWEHPILSIKGCDAIRPKLNCFRGDVKMQVAATATVCSHLQKVAILLFQFKAL